jgi:hypothetical protein
MPDYKTRLLLACLAVLCKRAGLPIVLVDEDVEAALASHTEVMWEHDRHAKCLRLTVPVESAT